MMSAAIGQKKKNSQVMNPSLLIFVQLFSLLSWRVSKSKLLDFDTLYRLGVQLELR